jgi:hypothetical protein
MSFWTRSMDEVEGLIHHIADTPSVTAGTLGSRQRIEMLSDYCPRKVRKR